MRLRWDESKRQQVLGRREIDFAWLDELLCLPYLEDQRNDDPEQYRIIGLASGRPLTFVVEYRQDHLGEYVWVITAWASTGRSKKLMTNSSKPDIEEIAEKAQRGEDVSRYFSGKHIAKQCVNIDFPIDLLRQIDADCNRIGITRQAWIKMACDERLRQIIAGLAKAS